MKNKFLFFGMISLLIGIIFAGCIVVPSKVANFDFDNRADFLNGPIAVKDYQPLGMVFHTESVFIKKDIGKPSITGNILTYQTLLKKAEDLGADAIINVAIDYKYEGFDEVSATGASASERIYTWYGSALAIKYTNAIMPQR